MSFEYPSRGAAMQRVLESAMDRWLRKDATAMRDISRQCLIDASSEVKIRDCGAPCDFGVEVELAFSPWGGAASRARSNAVSTFANASKWLR